MESNSTGFFPSLSSPNSLPVAEAKPVPKHQRQEHLSAKAGYKKFSTVIAYKEASSKGIQSLYKQITIPVNKDVQKDMLTENLCWVVIQELLEMRFHLTSLFTSGVLL